MLPTVIMSAADLAAWVREQSEAAEDLRSATVLHAHYGTREGLRFACSVEACEAEIAEAQDRCKTADEKLVGFDPNTLKPQA